MSDAIDRHRARVEELLGSTIKVTETGKVAPTSKGTVTETDNYYGPSVNPQTGEYVSPVPFYGPSVNPKTGEYSPPYVAKPSIPTPVLVPSSNGPTVAELEQRAHDARMRMYGGTNTYRTPPVNVNASSGIKTEHVLIGAGVLAMFGLVVVLARR